MIPVPDGLTMIRTPTLWKFTAREIQRRPGRTLLTLAGIVIGVATLVAITATTRATRKSYRSMFEAVGGKAALEIVAPGVDGGFNPDSIYRSLEEIKSIKPPVGTIQALAGLIQGGQRLPVLVLGLDPERDRAARTWTLSEGQGLGSGKGVVLVDDFARQIGCKLGQPVWLVTPAGLVERPLIGTVKPEGPAVFNAGAIVLMPLDEAQRLFQMPGKVTAVQLVLDEGADPQSVEAEVRKVLPPGYDVQSPAARSEIAREGLLTTDQALSALSVVSLVGGAFVILNSFLMNLGERRRQLAILRALGTTRGQMMRLLLREALLLGGVGTLLGMLLGVGMASGILRMQEELLGVKLPPMEFTAWPFVLAMIVGPGMALAATIVPAWRAGKRSPLEAMRPKRSGPEPGEGRTSWPSYLGIAMILLVGVWAAGSINHWWPGGSADTLALAMFSLLIGCVLALPLFLGPLFRLTGAILRPIFGTEGRLALRQLERQRTRTGLTVGVLFIGVVVTTGFGHSLLNNIRDIDTWYTDTIPADFMVRGVMPQGGTMTAAPMARERAAEIARPLPGVAPPVGRVNFVFEKIDGRPVIVIARDFFPGRSLPLSLVEGKEADVRRGLAEGGAVPGIALTERTGLKVGDKMRLQTLEGEKEVPIVGVTKEYTVGGMVVYLDWPVADRLLNLGGLHAVEVFAEPGKAKEAEASLRDYCDKRGLQLQTNEELRAFVDRAIQAVVGFLWVLLTLVFVVGLLGATNTLTMNVYEQTRELGVLRAIGLKRGQLRKLVIAQAAALGVLSVLPGSLFGLLMAWVMNLATRPFSGHDVPFKLNLGFAAVCSLAALTVAILAAVLPARRASRLDVLQALRYE